jgi:AraC-like DNA-binding protein
MGYLDAIKGGIIASVIFIIAVIFIPGKGASEDIQLILTVTTFLFAILVGFFIARAGSRFNEMRRTVGTEDALFLSFYKTAQAQGEKFASKIRELMDKYYITSYDAEISGYNYKESLPYFLEIWDETINLKPKKLNLHNQLFDVLTTIEEQRNLASAISKEKVSKGQWGVLLILSAIILFCLFYMKTGDIYSLIITVLLSTALMIILLLLRDLQNLKLGEEKFLLEESGQEIFEVMGKLRYYNHSYFKKGDYSLPKHVKKYRLGYHKAGEKFKIKIVENKS